MLVAFAVCASAPASAQERPLSLRAGITSVWDNNVFRVAESAPDPLASEGISGKADRSLLLNAGLRWDHNWSQQRFSLDVNASATRFDKFKRLDRDTSGYTGAWAWVLTPRIRGNLTASRTQSAVEQGDVLGLREVVVRTTTSRAATVDAWITGGWHLLGGLSHTEQSNSRDFAPEPATRHDSGEFGARYAWPSGSAISFLRRAGSGEQDAANTSGLVVPATEFQSRENELRANWIISPRSSLVGKLTHTSRKHEQAPDRDFSGTGSELTWSWLPTGRLSLTTALYRRVDPYLLGGGVSHRLEDALTFSPSWSLAPRISLRGLVSHRRTEYVGSLTNREDRLNGVEGGVVWTPYRVLSLTATVRRDARSSTDPTFSYKAGQVSLSALFTL